jgi:hypothetical protein
MWEDTSYDGIDSKLFIKSKVASNKKAENIFHQYIITYKNIRCIIIYITWNRAGKNDTRRAIVSSGV